MKYISYAESIHDLHTLHECGLKEVILSNNKLSRLCKTNDYLPLALEARKLDLKITLEWDILISDQDFDQSIKDFQEIPNDLYDSVRVQDFGVLEYLLNNSSVDIQLILETGNHNLIGINKWVSYIGARLDRLVLSIELNKDKIKEYSSELNCELELLVFGRVLLFYSPRKLLSPISSGEKQQVVSNEYLEAIGESEESPHKGFPVVENRHGTFMFHVKDLFLLDKYEELENINLNYLRLDLRHLSDLSLLKLITDDKSISQSFSNVKSAYDKDVIRGYFQINKSDVLFKKLKNYRIQRKDDSYIGEVIEIVKGDYLAILIKSEQSLKVDDEIKYITPEGKEYLCKVHFLRDVTYKDVSKKAKGELALINYMGGVWPKSQVYKAD